LPIWAATKRAESFPVSREIHFGNLDVLALDISPDIHFSPIEQRLHAHVFALARAGDELSPELRRLIFVIPFKLRVSRRKISFLRASGIFIPPNSRDERVPFIFGERL